MTRSFGENPAGRREERRVQTQVRTELRLEKMTGNIAESLFALANEERTRRGLGPLLLDPDLSGIAEKHSRDMSEAAGLSHISSDRKTYAQRLSVGQVFFQAAGENVVFSETFVPEIIHQSLMDSPNHREEILTPGYDFIGIGVVYSKDKKGFFVTQDFLRSLTYVPIEKGEADLRKRINELRARRSVPPLQFIPDFDLRARDYAEVLAKTRNLTSSPRLWWEAYIVHLSTPDLFSENLIGQILLSTRYEKAGLGLHFGRTEHFPGGVYDIVLFLLSRNEFLDSSKKELRGYVLRRMNEWRVANGAKEVSFIPDLNRAAESAMKKGWKTRSIPPGYGRTKSVLYMFYETESPDVMPEKVLQQILHPWIRSTGIAVRWEKSRTHPLGLLIVVIALSE